MITDNEICKKAANILKLGGVVLSKTDTVYGLLADSQNIDAVNKIYEIKNRDYTKKLAIFAPNVEFISQICKVSESAKIVLQNLLPGHFTFILDTNENGQKLFPWLEKFEDKSIGIRIPKDDFITSLMRETGFPISATSANISANPDSSVFENISLEIQNLVDYIVKDDNIIEKEPSSVIDLRNFEKEYKILRNTRYTIDFILLANAILSKTDLIKITNIGEKTRAELFKIGIYCKEDFDKFTATEIYKKLVNLNKKNKHKMLFYALFCAKFDINCMKIPSDIKQIADLEFSKISYNS
ncbi:L-threonylcarbamoyladenylate synthase [Candidatus Deianiraea vastatrix]|uniref:L-threonylcarbamoyladenylate synthase n=1 Tax=Candidatus Deianiraea vastatrix TaxID=2163644 RepID=A0A5B8XID5_9RICK|nr:L-threonylcarbamoyladenylate synthase [Candidatus Deianiraea vastatrix]QED23477.1 Putative YwlC family threonylcarbamoyl-AMP synthase [Candidatus Deianiraea vastatrix]